MKPRGLTRAFAALSLAAVISAPQAAWAHRVLVIGDSQSVGSFGSILARLFAANGHQVRYSARKSATPRFFLQSGHWSPGSFERTLSGYERVGGPTSFTPRFADLAAAVNPDLVVVQLGGNLLRLTRAHAESEIIEMTEALRAEGRPCAWIGPPQGWARNQARLSETYDDLALHLAGTCLLVDSRPLAEFPSSVGDGIHYDSITLLELVARGHCRRGMAGLARFEGCANGVQRSELWARRAYAYMESTLPGLMGIAVGDGALPIETGDLGPLNRHGPAFVERYFGIGQ